MLPVASPPEWPWSSFPQAAELRPPKKFCVEVMAALRDTLAPRPPLRVQPGFVFGEAARRRFVAFVSAMGTHRLGTQDVPPLVRRGGPGVCMGPDAAGLPWLPVWRRGVPRALCLPWHGRRRRTMSPGSG